MNQTTKQCYIRDNVIKFFLLSPNQQKTLAFTGYTITSMSILINVIALWWSCFKKKLYRKPGAWCIVLLIASDCVSSIFLLIFAIYTLSNAEESITRECLYFVTVTVFLRFPMFCACLMSYSLNKTIKNLSNITYTATRRNFVRQAAICLLLNVASCYITELHFLLLPIFWIFLFAFAFCYYISSRKTLRVETNNSNSQTLRNHKQSLQWNMAYLLVSILIVGIRFMAFFIAALINV